jgi:hypothetical protein
VPAGQELAAPTTPAGTIRSNREPGFFGVPDHTARYFLKHDSGTPSIRKRAKKGKKEARRQMPDAASRIAPP